MIIGIHAGMRKIMHVFCTNVLHLLIFVVDLYGISESLIWSMRNQILVLPQQQW
jgi:hypothetical protein